MYALRSLAARGTRYSICTQCLQLNARTITGFTKLTSAHSHLQIQSSRPPPSFRRIPRQYSTKTSADSLIEEIQDQYATARDEFEIAAEETEKKSVYAADDRAAAREELDKLKAMYEGALNGPDSEEIKGRIGQRIRELDSAVQAIEKSALED